MLEFGIEPMLAKSTPTLPPADGLPGGCAYEPKFDGYRALLFVTEHGCRIQSRGRHDITDAFTDIATAATRQLPDGVVLDGELVIWDDGALDFPALAKRLATRPTKPRRPASFVAFDLLEAADIDLRGKALTVRRQALETVMATTTPPLQLVPQTTDRQTAQAWFDDYSTSAIGIEGLVIKGRRSTYQPGKRGWSKLRIRDTTDVVVVAVTGTLQQPGRLIVALPEDDRSLPAAGSTLELTTTQRRQVAGLLAPAGEDHPWSADTTTSSRWGKSPERLTLVDPTLIIEVSADTSFENGRWRHPLRFIRPRPPVT